MAGVKVSVPFGSWSPGADRPNQEWITIFAGWFLGLIVAEWRAAGSAQPVPAAAARLAPRPRLRSRTVRRRLAVAVAVALAIGGWLAVRLIVEETIRRTTLGLAACTLVAALLLGLTVRRVLTRPQTAADDAIRQADQGLRARSLTLLAGGAIVLLTRLGAVMLALIGLSYHPGPFTGPLAGVGGYGVLLALLGVIAGAYTGTEPTPPPRSARSRPAHTPSRRADVCRSSPSGFRPLVVLALGLAVVGDTRRGHAGREPPVPSHGALARRLVDREQIVVPKPGQSSAPAGGSSASVNIDVDLDSPTRPTSRSGPSCRSSSVPAGCPRDTGSRRSVSSPTTSGSLRAR